MWIVQFRSTYMLYVVICIVYSCWCIMCQCRWSDVTCRHLYCVFVLVYYVPVQVEWRYMSSSVLCIRAGVLCAGAGGVTLHVVICIVYSCWYIMCRCRWSDVVTCSSQEPQSSDCCLWSGWLWQVLVACWLTELCVLHTTFVNYCICLWWRYNIHCCCQTTCRSHHSSGCGLCFCLCL